MYLIFDVETTGFPNNSLSANDPQQAHIVQLAVILLDEQFNEKASFNTLIKPAGWIVPEDVVKIHGKSTEDCERYGIPIKAAVEVFQQFSIRAEKAVAHNMQFDKRMLSMAISVVDNIPFPGFQFPDSICTMEAMTNVCKLYGKVKGKFKWPKLQEAYSHIYGKPFDKAHDALADVRACAAILKWLITNGKIALNEPVLV